jgi:acyl transferase domain-containing protein
VEADAIGKILGKSLKGVRPLFVGSVKSNIGHLEPASGIAGLIKSLLIFKHGKIPKNLHFHTPHPEINFQSLNISIPKKLSPLPDVGGGELIGVNSFGFGGTNAHVVLQKPDKKRNRKASANRGTPLPPLFLSAGSAVSLNAMAKIFAERLKSATPALYYDTAATLALQHETLPYRAVITGATLDEICIQAKNFGRRSGPASRVIISSVTAKKTSGVFVYTGNGSQWLGMGKTLLEKNQNFRNAIEKIDQLFATLQNWSILELLRNGDKYKNEYEHAEKNQPLLFAIQVALTQILADKGLVPSAVIGHSVGEIAAAWAAGALTLQDAVRIIYFRSVLQEPLRGTGAMAVVNVSENTAREMLKHYDGKIEIAAFNTRSSFSLSGDRGALQTFVKECRQKRIAAKVLNIPYPYHTMAMDKIKRELLSTLAELRPKRAKIPFYSCVIGNILRKAPDAAYWFDNLRCPVLFTRAVEESINNGFSRFWKWGQVFCWVIIYKIPRGSRKKPCPF